MSAVTSEAILFYDGDGINKIMLYSDFEAILDGMVGMPDYAGKDMRGGYCLVNGHLQVVAAVLFKIQFDDSGMADPSWNLPLRHLAEHGGPGPDMGGGVIRLACHSQCPVAWHQDQLWDPSMKPGHNDFVIMRDAVKERGGRIGLYIDDTPSLSPQQSIPVAQAAVPAQQEVAPPTLTAEPDIPVVQPDAAPPQRSERDEQERQRIARTLKELRLRAQTQESKHNEELAQLRYAHQQKEEILSTQLEKILMQMKSLKSQNTALKEKSTALKSQVDSLNESLQEQVSRASEQGSELEILTEQYKVALEQRLEEERARLAEEMHAKEMEVLDREEKISQLKQDVNEAQQAQTKMANVGAEKLLEKLQGLGLNFIAFHAGAGHISINASEISGYMQNPIAYAAKKCLVTEEHYKAWLEHYDNPVCKVQVAEGKCCGKRVLRVDVPNQFKAGVSDRNQNRCQYCRSDSAIDNVLKFR